MTLRQIDALSRAENKANKNANGTGTRDWGTAADLVAFASKKG